MNVAHCFAEYLQDELGIATLGQDLFVGDAPSSNKVQRDIWWVKASGGSPTKHATGEAMKLYFVEVYCRHRDYGAVHDALQALEEALNIDGCSGICTYDTVDISAAVLSIDDDLDAEDRKVGFLQANLRVYDDGQGGVS